MNQIHFSENVARPAEVALFPNSSIAGAAQPRPARATLAADFTVSGRRNATCRRLRLLPIVHMDGGRKDRHPLTRNIWRSANRDLTQSRETGQEGDSLIRDTCAFIELDALERWHAPKNLQAAVGDTCGAGIVCLQPG